MVLERDTMTLDHPLHWWLLYDYWFLSKSQMKARTVLLSVTNAVAVPAPAQGPAQRRYAANPWGMNERPIGRSNQGSEPRGQIWSFGTLLKGCVCVCVCVRARVPYLYKFSYPNMSPSPPVSKLGFIWDYLYQKVASPAVFPK